jgi:hypothetical protein
MKTTFTVHHNEHVSSRSFEEVVSAFESVVGSVEETGFPALLATTKSAEEFEARVKSREKARAALCASSRPITGPGWHASD